VTAEFELLSLSFNHHPSTKTMSEASTQTAAEKLAAFKMRRALEAAEQEARRAKEAQEEEVLMMQAEQERKEKEEAEKARKAAEAERARVLAALAAKAKTKEKTPAPTRTGNKRKASTEPAVTASATKKAKGVAGALPPVQEESVEGDKEDAEMAPAERPATGPSFPVSAEFFSVFRPD
jgi:hypothetical protein